MTATICLVVYLLSLSQLLKKSHTFFLSPSALRFFPPLPSRTIIVVSFSSSPLSYFPLSFSLPLSPLSHPSLLLSFSPYLSYPSVSLSLILSPSSHPLLSPIPLSHPSLLSPSLIIPFLSPRALRTPSGCCGAPTGTNSPCCTLAPGGVRAVSARL